MTDVVEEGEDDAAGSAREAKLQEEEEDRGQSLKPKIILSRRRYFLWAAFTL